MSETDIPAHIGIILDGNRRWAKANNLSALEGHRKGGDNLTIIAKQAFKRGVQYVSAFVFSTENWTRSQREVNYLMNLVPKMMDNYLEDLHQEGIKVLVLGRREGLRSKVLAAIERVEEKTRGNTKGVLALCFNYGGREELADAVKSLIQEQSQNNIEGSTRVNTLEPADLAKHLYGPEIPDIDLLIRTSGEHRLSNFMLYRLAYAELYFTDTTWPAYSTQELDTAIDWYGERDRRFGV